MLDGGDDGTADDDGEYDDGYVDHLTIIELTVWPM